MSEYEALTTTYDVYQTAAVNNALALTGVIDLTAAYGGLLSRRSFTLGGNTTINGSGVIFAARTFVMTNAFRSCVSPDAGQTITIISRQNNDPGEYGPYPYRKM